MALDIQRMLGQLSPARPIDLGGSSGAREQLRLQRERFEFEKQQAQKEKELRLLEEQGRMARARMDKERLAAEEQAKLEAQQQAALLAQQQAALGKAGELAGTGKGQQLHGQSVLMDQLGYDMNSLGSVGGLPVYDFVNRAQAQAAEDQAFEQGPRAIDQLDGSESATQSLARMQELGYPTNERGTLDDATPTRSVNQPTPGESAEFAPQVGGVDESTADALTPGDADMATAEELAGGGELADVSVGGRGMGPASLSTGDAFARALAASRYAQATGQPARGPDEEDYMGAVPRNRIDMPAMAAETLARLNPALKARVAGLPDELRPAARQNAEAIAGLGLEATDALAEQDKAMRDPVSIYNNQQQVEAQKEKAQTLSPMDMSTFRVRGADAAKELADKRGVSKVLEAVVKADEVLRVLDDPLVENDRMIAPALMAAQGVQGVPSNTDLQFAFSAKSSLIGDIVAKVEEAIQGGLSTAQRNAIRAYLKAVKESQRQIADGFLDSAFQRMDQGSFNEHERNGYRDYIEQSVPPSWYNDYWSKRDKAEKSGQRAAPAARAGQGGADVAGELERQAKSAGFDVEAIRPLVGTESGGDPNAKNKMGSSASGLFQFTDETAKDYGLKDAAEYRALPAAKQIELGLKRFKDLGLDANSTADDFAMANAAPGYLKAKPGTVIEEYRSGTERGDDVRAKNPGWIPADGGEITNDSIRDFYRRSRGKSPAKGPERKADGENPYPDDAKATELLKRL